MLLVWKKKISFYAAAFGRDNFLSTSAGNSNYIKQLPYSHLGIFLYKIYSISVNNTSSI